MKTSLLSALILLFGLSSCSSMPDDIEQVNGFEIERYLGKWFEIARLDHGFERGLTQVTAVYSWRDDGGIKVINRGYNEEKKVWNEAIGRAYFVQTPNIGQLKVSFFGPFYGGYNIIELDKEHYQYALIFGPSKNYLWILARSPQIEQGIVKKLVGHAKELGFPTEDLIFLY